MKVFLLPEPVASLRMRNYHLQVQLSMAFSLIPRGLTNTKPSHQGLPIQRTKVATRRNAHIGYKV